MAFAANHCAFVIWHTLLTFTLIRFGVLATVAALYTAFIIEEFPLTTNWSAWYAPADLLGIATLIALALYGFVTTLWGWGLWAETGHLLEPATMADDSHTITRLLLDCRSGNTDAAARLMELVYRELYQMASRQMRLERGEHTL